MTTPTAQLIAAAKAGLQQRLAHIPRPEDAVTVSDWDNDGCDFRTFSGSSWRIAVTEELDYIVRPWGTADIQVDVQGVQYASGRIERWPTIGPVPEDLPPTTARMLSQTLTQALAEIDRLN